MVWWGARNGRVVTTAVRSPVRPATLGPALASGPRRLPQCHLRRDRAAVVHRGGGAHPHRRTDQLAFERLSLAEALTHFRPYINYMVLGDAAKAPGTIRQLIMVLKPGASGPSAPMMQDGDAMGLPGPRQSPDSAPATRGCSLAEAAAAVDGHHRWAMAAMLACWEPLAARRHPVDLAAALPDLV
jgi:hypothetical protein